MIPGFFYFENVLSPAYSDELRAFLESAKDEMQSVGNAQNSRKVIHYGYAYPYKKKEGALEKIEDIPEILLSLRKMITNGVWKDAPEDIEERLNQCIINIYEPGQGIAPHIDDVRLFGDTIVSFTLFSSREISFTRGKERVDIQTNPNSVYILTGDARYSYKHQMKKRKKDKKVPRGRVVSITFREYIEK